MKTIGILILLLLSAFILLLVYAALRTIRTPAKTSGWHPSEDPLREEKYAGILSRMVRYETVSVPGDSQREKFLGFHRLLEKEFPLVHSRLEKTELDGSLIFYWKGKHSDRPLVLMGHQDVVPAEGEWAHAPFSGDISDRKVWGRGSADTKCSVMSFFQAVEELLEEGFVPEEDVYLTSSSTEEVAGGGCPLIVEELKRRGVKPYLVLDEGGAIVKEPIKGFPGYYAMIGVLEKGSGNILVRAKSSGGHSSYPPKNSPIARLAKFITRIEKHDPMKAAFEPEVEAMFTSLAPYGTFLYRMLFGNLKLFKPLLKKVMPAISPQAAALLKTTVAFTMQSGSDGRNVMPQEATLNLNLRYIPHQGMAESNAVIEKLAKKYDLTAEPLDCRDYCEPVNIRSRAYGQVESVINEIFPGLPVCPYVMTGGTDARFYQEICDACIRFSPVVYGPEQMKGMHGLNECIDTFSLPGAVDFYKAMIRRNKAGAE